MVLKKNQIENISKENKNLSEEYMI